VRTVYLTADTAQRERGPPPLEVESHVLPLELDRARAESVAEHAGVGFSAESGHGDGFEVGSEFLCLSVEGVDLGADRFVFVGDDTVGDPGVGEGHFHRAVAE
jgi:hypothetical protein